jgi:hypothetical protein
MSRLIVTNSSLYYPQPPSSVRAVDDLLLPLPQYFEDAMFLQSRFYEGFQQNMSERYWEVERVARHVGALLPDLLTQPAGESAWECFLGSFIKFTMGPLLAAAEAVETACEEARPEQIIAWDEPRSVSWWGGRQLVDDVALRASEITGAPVSYRSGSFARAVRSASHGPLTRARAARYYLRQLRPASGQLPGQYDVIIPAFGRTIRGMLREIGGRLVAEGLRVLMVEMPRDPLRPGPADTGLPHFNLYDLRDEDLLRQSFFEVDASFDWHRHFAEAVSRCPALPLQGRLREALVRRMHNITAYEMPFQLYHRRLWRRLLDEVRPRALLAFNHYGTALASGVLQANQRGMATVLCQHGMGSAHWSSTTLLPFDLALTFGDYASELLSSVAYPSTEFAVTGHSAWDNVRAAADLQRPDLQQRPVVLATMQTSEQHLGAAEARWWLRCLAAACRELGAQLVIKPHPNETCTLAYEQLAREMPETVSFVPHGERPLAELIDECTVLATRYSTTAVEAIIAGKLVMTVYPSGDRERYPLAGEGAAVKVDSCEELLPALRALLTDTDLQERLASNRDSFLRRHVGPLDGGATDRIVEHLLRVTAEASPAHGSTEAARELSDRP